MTLRPPSTCITFPGRSTHAMKPKTTCRTLTFGVLRSTFCVRRSSFPSLLTLPAALVLCRSLLLADETALLRGTVTDAATGAPAACTVTITDASGKTVTETDAFKGGFRCAGAFEKRLPAGRTRVRVTRGFETRAEARDLLLQGGATTDVAVALCRAVDLRSRGWIAGDSHAHMIHGERNVAAGFAFVGLTARAEDLSYLSLAHAWQLEDPTPERLDAALAPHAATDCALAWNLEAPKNYYKGDAGRCLGHCWTLGLRGRTAGGADVIPLLLRASAWDYESAKPTFANFESHALIHAQGGASFYLHPLRWWIGPWGGQGGYPKRDRMRVSNMAVELPLDTLLGPTYDGLDVFTSGGEAEANDKAFHLWSLLLNPGYRVAATASSDACFDRPGGAVPGSARTYTYLGPEPFSLAAVARATAAGRTFATTGPLLLADVDSLPPGSAVPADGQAHTLRIEAWASGKDSAGLKQAEILRNGQPFFVKAFKTPQATWQTNLVLREAGPAWYCVRLTGGPQGGRAISGAFFFDPAPHRPPPTAECRVRARVVDAVTGRPLDATLTEVFDVAFAPHDGARHPAPGGESAFVIPGTIRLRAEAPGYAATTLSPVYDCPALVEAITRLDEADLLSWGTFERMRALLANIELTFSLTPATR